MVLDSVMDEIERAGCKAGEELCKMCCRQVVEEGEAGKAEDLEDLGLAERVVEEMFEEGWVRG